MILSGKGSAVGNSDARTWAGLLWAGGMLALILGFSRVSFGLLLPTIMREMPAAFSTYGWVAAANFAGYLVGNASLPGALRIGLNSRLLNILCFSAMAATTLGMAFAQNLYQIAALRFINGLAQAAVLNLTIAMAIELREPSERGRVSALLWSGGAFGMAICGLLGTMVALDSVFTWRSVWLAMGCLSVVVGCGFFATTRPEDGPRSVASGVGDFAVQRAPFVLLCAAYGFFGIAFGLFFTYFTAFARALSIAPSYLGLLWTLFGVAGALGAFIGGSLIDRLGHRHVAGAMPILGSLGVALMLQGSPGYVLCGFVFFALSVFAFSTVFTTVVRRYVSASSFATMFTITTLVFAVGQVGAGPLGGFLADRAGLSCAMIATALALVLTGLATAMAAAYRTGRQ